jgi:hypothetical protein
MSVQKTGSLFGFTLLLLAAQALHAQTPRLAAGQALVFEREDKGGLVLTSADDPQIRLVEVDGAKVVVRLTPIDRAGLDLGSGRVIVLGPAEERTVWLRDELAQEALDCGVQLRVEVLEGGGRVMLTTTDGNGHAFQTKADSAPPRRRAMRPPGVQPAVAQPTSLALIDKDLKAGKITDEQAFVYGVYAVFGSPSLPAQYQSTADLGIDSPINKELSNRLATLSPGAQASIAPYLIPPIYKGSWGDPDFVQSIQRGGGQPASLRQLPNGSLSACAGGAQATPLPGWAQKITAHFNIWYRTVTPPFYTNYYTTAEGEVAATNIAAVAEDVWASLTGLFDKFPLSDANEVCNGGDGAIDIYVDRMNTGALALTSAYPPGCAERPTWMWIAPDRILDPIIARDIFAHEFMHMIGFAYSRGAACEDYIWLDEAAGHWAIDYVYHNDQYEQVDYGRSAPCYYEYDFEVPIETTSRPYGSNCNGYSDYVFLFYLSNKLGPKTIKSIYEYAQTNNSLDSLEKATAGGDGLKKVWPDFVTAGWNDWQGGVADDFYKWDKLKEGRKLYFDQGDGGKFYGPESTKIELKGQSQKTFLLGSYVISGGTIEPLAARYSYLKFTDDNVRYVVFYNKPALLAASEPWLSIRALVKINGKWLPEDDWTNIPFKTFCRDAKDERIEELVVMYSNSNPARPAYSSEILLDKDQGLSFEPTVDVSNVGCWRWEGTSSVTSRATDGGTTVASATASFERFRDPLLAQGGGAGTEAYFTRSGVASYSINAPFGICTLSGAASSPIGVSDGVLTVHFNLPTFPTDQTALVFGDGTTSISITQTVTCPAGTQVSTGPVSAGWLSLPGEGARISDDGQSITGRSEETGSFATVISDWNFHAVREQ